MDDNPRPDLFNDRRTEGKRLSPTSSSSYAATLQGARLGVQNLQANAPSMADKMARSAKLAEASKAKIKARRAGTA